MIDSSNCLEIVGENKRTQNPAKSKLAIGARYPIRTYLVLAFALSWGFWLPLIVLHLSFSMRAWKVLYIGGLSGPLFASLVVTFATGGWHEVGLLLKRACLWKAAPGLYAVALGLFPALMIVAWGLSAAMGERHPTWIIPSLSMLPLTFVIMAIRGGPLNEEIGWRGFLLPTLLRAHTPFTASLILAGIWGAWHVPLWFLEGLPHPHWPYGLFLLLVISSTFLFTWLFLKSGGSVLLAILLHSSINTGIHYFPILPPRHPGLLPFEWWVGLTWVAAAVVLLKERAFWFSRRPLPAIPQSARQTSPEPCTALVSAEVESRDGFGAA